MKILIAGSGDTGTHLAKMLSNEKQDVVLMSAHRDYLESIDSTYNLMTFDGDPCSPADLKAAGAPDADMFIAVTPYGTRNMIACQLARQLGAGSTLARIETNEFNTPQTMEAFAKAGIDTMVYPEALVAGDIADYITRNWMVCRHELHQGQLVFSGLRISETSPLAGLCLREIGGERHFHIAAIRRQRETIIPKGSDSILPGDTLYCTYASKDEDLIRCAAGFGLSQIRHIIITGSSNLVALILDRLSKTGISISLISRNLEFCTKMSGRFPKISVSHTAPSDIQTLNDEGIHGCDLFMALEDTASENIVGAITAKELGAKRCVAQIEDLQYMAEAERLGIDKIINKKLITSAVILRSVMGSQLHVRSMISLDDVEVAELEVGHGAAVSKGIVSQLSIPPEMTLGGLVHEGESKIITGRTQIETGDLVLVVFRPGALDKVVKLFRSKKLLG